MLGQSFSVVLCYAILQGRTMMKKSLLYTKIFNVDFPPDQVVLNEHGRPVSQAVLRQLRILNLMRYVVVGMK